MVQAFALSLMNTANAVINKIPLLLSGEKWGNLPKRGIYCKVYEKCIQRNLQKIVDEACHTNPKELKELKFAVIKGRNELIADTGRKKYIRLFRAFERAVIRRIAGGTVSTR